MLFESAGFDPKSSLCEAIALAADYARWRKWFATVPQTKTFQPIVNHLLSKPDEVKAAMAAFSSIGADGLLMWPCAAEMSQFDLLAEELPR